jgi:RNA polymerase sigma-70 factor (ECF subfamily)
MQFDSAHSFNAVYTAYYRKSFLFVKSYVHNELVAEDIVSESLIRLWGRMKLQPVEHVSSYLFTILKNSALDHLKHEAVERKAFNSLNEKLAREREIRISTLQSCDPDEIFSTEIQQIIHATLATLPEKSRKVFMMSRFENKTNKEIADIFDITVKGVDYHIALAIKALRVSLKDYLPLFFYFLVR